MSVTFHESRRCAFWVNHVISLILLSYFRLLMISIPAKIPKSFLSNEFNDL